MEANRPTRIDLINRLEELQNSRVVCYFCGDRPLTPSAIAQDAVRFIYEHLLDIGEAQKISLYLYSRGGSLETPWRIVTTIREFTTNFEVIIPYKAYSAATLVALGADSIMMGRKGELSPVDPSLRLSESPKPGIPTEIGVEDISSYITFIKERAGLTDQDAVSNLVEQLSKDLTPVILGQTQRAYSHIRLIARKLLSVHKKPLPDLTITKIIQDLSEKIYLHGHGIGRSEALGLGLPIKKPKDNEHEEIIWNLYKQYEELLDLNSSTDIWSYFPDENVDNLAEEEKPIAIIESNNKLHAFVGSLRARKKRQIPQNLSLNLNVPLQLPPNIRVEDLPQNIQQLLQRLIQQAMGRIQNQVTQELQRQCPVEKVEHRFHGGRWIEIF